MVLQQVRNKSQLLLLLLKQVLKKRRKKKKKTLTKFIKWQMLQNLHPDQINSEIK